MLALHRRKEQANIWPGFVDALSALIMVVIFLLMIFVISHFFLNLSLEGRDRQVDQLNQEITSLATLLSLEQKKTDGLQQNLENLQGELSASILQAEDLNHRLTMALVTIDEKDTLLEDARLKQAELLDEAQKLAVTKQALEQDIAALQALKNDMQVKIASQSDALSQAEKDKIQDQAELARLNQQIQALRTQLGSLEQLLRKSEAKDAQQQAQIADLGKRLNVALASKVNELSRYRSEFFGKLREILGKRQDVQIVGDRFIFQSEVLFDQGSAELGLEGRLQLARLANSLQSIIPSIPDNINWVLQVEGHTDKIPIKTQAYPSNWELSTARALSVVHFLMGQNISPEHLAAAGFADFQPLNPAETPDAYRQNRRIELKFTSR